MNISWPVVARARIKVAMQEYRIGAVGVIVHDVGIGQRNGETTVTEVTAVCGFDRNNVDDKGHVQQIGQNGGRKRRDKECLHIRIAAPAESQTGCQSGKSVIGRCKHRMHRAAEGGGFDKARHRVRQQPGIDLKVRPLGKCLLKVHFSARCRMGDDPHPVLRF